MLRGGDRGAKPGEKRWSRDSAGEPRGELAGLPVSDGGGVLLKPRLGHVPPWAALTEGIRG